jgi:hypothetical protein
MSLTALAVFSTGALAQQLLTTTDTGTQGAGGSLLEVGYSRERTRVGRGEEKETERLRALDATYTYGLTETIDVYAGVSHVRLRFENEDGREHASGFSNTAIGAKWRFFDNEASGTSLAIVPEIALPVSSQREDDGLGAGRISGSLTLALSQTLPFGSLNFNAGIGRDRYRHGDDETIRSFSVAPVWEISERWTVALDTGIDLARAGGSTVRSKFSEITAVYAPTENVEVSIAYIRATDDEHPRAKTNAVAVGVAWAF